MIQNVQSLKTEIRSILDLLPPASLQSLYEFSAFLQTKAEQADTQRPVIRLGGLWADTPEITEEDIADARREMWGHFGERVS